MAKMLSERIAALFAPLEPWYRAIGFSVALVLSAAFTYSTWHFADDTAGAEAAVRFDFRARQIGEAIRGRIVDYEQVLRGGAGLFAASDAVTRGDWRAYVERLRIEKLYPGIQGLGFARVVKANEKAAHEASVRAEGYADYAIRPGGIRDEYTSIVFLEPFTDRNLRAFGYDMFSEAVRRQAMERARDSGEPVASGRVTLVQETDQDVQGGFLVYVPVYQRGRDPVGVADRRAALLGYVYSPFRMRDLIRGILGDTPDVRVRIFDGDAALEDALLYDSAPGRADDAPMYRTTMVLTIPGRNWTLQVASLPAFERAVDRTTPVLVALASALLSTLVLGIIWVLASLRARAERLARAMTRELNESRQQLSLALEGSNLALFDWDVLSGRVELSERWNVILGGDSRRLTTTITELQSLVHPEDMPVLQKQLSDVLRGNARYYRVEHRVRTHDGGWKWVESNAKVTERDAQGRAVRLTGTNADISVRKEVERIKSEFIATVSHELRTPLTAVIGALGLLKEQARGTLGADAATFLDMAQQNSDRLASLINDILDIEKIESGRMEFLVEPLALRPFLEHALAMNHMIAERYGVAFRLEEPVPDVAMMADRDRALQVLTNLLSNAAKYSPHGQIVSIAASARNGMVRVAVTDRGAGIPASFRGRIFQKFAQADGSDTRRKGGTGLGLSISKAIIEKLGGTLDYESTVGKGATFYFDLPVKG